MLSIEDQEIVVFFEKLINDKKFLEIPEEVFAKMTVEHGILIRDYLKGTQFVKLPKSEIYFFEWLKENDPAVWNDLWAVPEEIQKLETYDIRKEPYLVGLVFLPLILEKDGRGFPICDLLTVDNYYFSMSFMQDEESKVVIESSRERFMDRASISTAQLLALEISIGAIDIWHFAFKHKISLSDAKLAVEELVEDGALVHLKEAEMIAHFIEF